jgi:hypothetical protein
VVVTTAFALIAAAGSIALAPAAHAASSGNVVVNGKFAKSTAGWTTKGNASQRLKWKSGGHNSPGSARLKSLSGKKVVLNDAVNSIASAKKGEVVKATAWVRAKKPGLSGQLRLKEVRNGHRVAVGKAQFQLNTTGWTRVTLSYKVTKNGSSLDLNVVARHVGRHQALRVDDVKLKVTSMPAGPDHLTPGGKAMLGMSSPAQFWDTRVSEVGSGLQARRIFLNGFDASLTLVQKACSAGMYPIVSYKTGSYSWAQVAGGSADAALRAANAKLAALSCDVFVAVHHEPEQDGTAAGWAAMQVHALPILGVGADVQVGVIGNGWWWSATNQGYTDAEIAAWITPAVIKVSDVIAGDTYQSTTTSEEAGPKITRMGAWARRVGGVKALGVGEFNGPTAIGITNATKALAADPLFAWGCMWNSTGGIATVLTGARLTAFQTALANW